MPRAALRQLSVCNLIIIFYLLLTQHGDSPCTIVALCQMVSTLDETKVDVLKKLLVAHSFQIDVESQSRIADCGKWRAEAARCWQRNENKENAYDFNFIIAHARYEELLLLFLLLYIVYFPFGNEQIH